MPGPRCEHCGFQNPDDARICVNCATPLQPAQAPSQTEAERTTNPAVLSLILGLTGMVCCGPFTSIPGMILGKREMQAIREGRAPESNLKMAKAGFYVSIAATVIFVLLCVVLALLGYLTPFYQK